MPNTSLKHHKHLFFCRTSIMLGRVAGRRFFFCFSTSVMTGCFARRCSNLIQWSCCLPENVHVRWVCVCVCVSIFPFLLHKYLCVARVTFRRTKVNEGWSTIQILQPRGGAKGDLQSWRRARSRTEERKPSTLIHHTILAQIVTQASTGQTLDH